MLHDRELLKSKTREQMRKYKSLEFQVLEERKKCDSQEKEISWKNSEIE